MAETRPVIRAVLFDLDDTLYDRGIAFERWAGDYLREQCGIADEQERRAVLARIAALDAGGYGSKKAVVEELCRLHPPQGHAQHAEPGDFYEQFFTQLALDADALEFLALLGTWGVPWGVVTNGQARQWRKLERLDLIRRTPCLFVSGTFGCEKPDPAIFLAAANCLGVDPPEVLFVGDHPVNDILGARRCGMQTAWLHRGKPWPEGHVEPPGLTIVSLMELPSRVLRPPASIAKAGDGDRR